LAGAVVVVGPEGVVSGAAEAASGRAMIDAITNAVMLRMR
jgi:hypothetical protein